CTVEKLMWAGRDANRPRRSGRHCALGGGGPGADRGARIGRSGNVNGDLAQKISVAIEYLDAPITTIGDVDISLRIDCDAVRRVELSGAIAGSSPGFQPIAVFIHFGYAGIDVAVAYIGISLRIPSDVGHLPEKTVNWRKRRAHMLQWPGAFIGGFLLPSEDHHHAAGGIKFDYHV